MESTVTTTVTTGRNPGDRTMPDIGPRNGKMDAHTVPFTLPDIGEEEIAEVTETLRSGWLTTGERTARFERDFEVYTGAERALGVNSGTAAMHVALAALG